MNEDLDFIKNSLLYDFNENDKDLYKEYKDLGLDDKTIERLLLDHSKFRANEQRNKVFNLKLIETLEKQNRKIDNLTISVNEEKKKKGRAYFSLALSALLFLFGAIVLRKVFKDDADRVYEYVSKLVCTIKKIK